MNSINDFEGEYFFMDESDRGKHLEENIRGHCRINFVSPLSSILRKKTYNQAKLDLVFYLSITYSNKFEPRSPNKKPSAHLSGGFSFICDLDRIQTCNLLSRNQMRYSVAPRGLLLPCFGKGCKYISFFKKEKGILKN